jgi:hypothetical protein
MDDIQKTTEERLQLIRDSFTKNKCQWINTLTRDLIVKAIDAKIKEIVLLHDFRAKRCQGGYKESKEIIEDNIRIYEELKKQIEALPILEDV